MMADKTVGWDSIFHAIQDRRICKEILLVALVHDVLKIQTISTQAAGGPHPLC